MTAKLRLFQDADFSGHLTDTDQLQVVFCVHFDCAGFMIIPETNSCIPIATQKLKLNRLIEHCDWRALQQKKCATQSQIFYIPKLEGTPSLFVKVES